MNFLGTFLEILTKLKMTCMEVIQQKIVSGSNAFLGSFLLDELSRK